MHKDLLVASSPYFKAAFEGRFRECHEKSIQISDVTPAVFQLFLDWLYFRRLGNWYFQEPSSENTGKSHKIETTIERNNEEASSGEDSNEEEPDAEDCSYCDGICKRWAETSNPTTSTQYQYQFRTLSTEDDEIVENFIENSSHEMFCLYIFADRCDVPGLRQKIIEVEWKNYDKKRPLWAWHIVIHALRSLSVSTPLCRLLVDQWVDNWYDEQLTCGMKIRLRQKLPGEFLYAVMAEKGMKANEKEPKQRVRQLCSYHEHAQDKHTVQACIQRAKAERKRKREE